MVCSIVATCLWIDPDIELLSTVGDDGGGGSVVGFKDSFGGWFTKECGKRNPSYIIMGQSSILYPIMLGGWQHNAQLVCVLTVVSRVLADSLIAESGLLSPIKEVGGITSCQVSLLELLANRPASSCVARNRRNIWYWANSACRCCSSSRASRFTWINQLRLNSISRASSSSQVICWVACCWSRNSSLTSSCVMDDASSNVIRVTKRARKTLGRS